MNLGFNALITGRNRDQVDSAVSDLAKLNNESKVHGLVLEDVTSIPQRQRLCQRVEELNGGRLDALVYATSMSGLKEPQLYRCPASTLARMFDVNVISAIETVKLLLPALRKSQDPSVVLTSTVADFFPHLENGPYAAVKGSVSPIAKVLASELVGIGAPVQVPIRVNVVAPTSIYDEVKAKGKPPKDNMMTALAGTLYQK